MAIDVRGYAAQSATSPLEPFRFTRRDPRRDDVTIDIQSDESFVIRGIEAASIGYLCSRDGIMLHELTPINDSLEEAYMALTRDEVEYQTTGLVGV